MLAAAIVSLPGVQGLEEERHSNVIPLLCSIFLANQGAGEAAEEGRALTLVSYTGVIMLCNLCDVRLVFILLTKSS